MKNTIANEITKSAGFGALLEIYEKTGGALSASFTSADYGQLFIPLVSFEGEIAGLYLEGGGLDSVSFICVSFEAGKVVRIGTTVSQAIAWLASLVSSDEDFLAAVSKLSSSDEERIYNAADSFGERVDCYVSAGLFEYVDISDQQLEGLPMDKNVVEKDRCSAIVLRYISSLTSDE